MSTPIGNTATVMRRTAERLRQEARRLDTQADRLDVARRNIAEADVLTGRAGSQVLADLVTLNESVHYQEGLEILERHGFTVRGVDPAATLLTALTRNPRWRRSERHPSNGVTSSSRTGVYQRVA